jgi:hypothetical protein
MNLDKLIDKHLGKKMEEWRAEALVPVPPDVKITDLFLQHCLIFT